MRTFSDVRLKPNAGLLTRMSKNRNNDNDNNALNRTLKPKITLQRSSLKRALLHIRSKTEIV